MSSEAEMRADGGTIRSRMSMSAGGDPEPAADTSESARGGRFASARERIDDLSERAGALGDRVRDSVTDRLERVGRDLEDRTGVLGTVRAYPLAAAGLAFSLGFVVAAATGRGDRNWVWERTRRQLRTMIISGVTGALAQELRSLVGAEDGILQLVEGFLRDEDEVEEYDA